MRSLFLMLTAVLVTYCTVPAEAQTKKSTSKTEAGKPDAKGTYTYVDEMPQFNGDLTAYLTENLKYPADAVDKKIEGRVTVRFVVDYTGRVKDVTLVKGVNDLLDAEALRVVQTMPRWKPGKHMGSFKDVYMTLPVSFRLQATEDVGKSKGNEEIPKPLVFTFVEKMPEFEGNMSEYLAEHITYPEDAMDAGAEGRVTVRFVVDERGNVTDVTVVKSVHPSLDAEATRVVQAMPRWKPGMQNGETVKVYYTLPVVFKLSNTNKG